MCGYKQDGSQDFLKKEEDPLVYKNLYIYVDQLIMVNAGVKESKDEKE